MDKYKIVVFYIIVFIIHTILLFLCDFNGKNFYENNNNNNNKIYDISHQNLPNLSNNNLLKVLMNLYILYLFILICSNNLIYEFLTIHSIFLILRGISINITILPKDKNCNNDIDLFTKILDGHCYDKIFSGHFGITFIMNMLSFKKNIISLNYFILSSVVIALIILLIRSHYSIDIFVSFIVCYLIFVICE